MKRIHRKEFDALVAMRAEQRYATFVARVADWEELWSLRGEAGWVTAEGEDGREAFPVWPHAEFASACAAADWQGTEPFRIGVYEFVDQWLPDFTKEGRTVAVFPTPVEKGLLVDPTRLAEDLERELEQYE